MSAVKAQENGVHNTPKPLNRVARYDWKSLSTKGRLEEIDKNLLNVDHEYQRDNIAKSRILDIARDWDWRACGVILVARRSDGTYWIYDGQHRVLAAKKREEITTLPCLVFDVLEKREEAAGFVASNTIRGPVKSLEKFKARLAAEDSIALEVADMVESIGYVIDKSPTKYHLQCVAAIESEMLKDRETAETVLQLCAEIYDGQPIQNRAFKGICYVHNLLKKHGDKITRPDVRAKLIKCGPDEIERSINSAIAYRSGSGEKVYADGIVTLVNKGKRSQHVPSIFK